MSELNANSVDSDQTPRSAASDLSLHCLPLSLLWDARLKGLNLTLLCRNRPVSMLLRYTFYEVQLLW